MTEHNMSNYEDTYASFSWERPEKYNFARDVIDHWASQDANKLAMIWIDDNGNELKRTFNDISSASKKLSNVLVELGVQRGDTIILMLGRNIEWWEVFTASLRMGAVISPGTTQLSAKDLSYRINAAGATCVITDDANASKLDEVINECPSIRAKLVIDAERTDWTAYQSVMVDASDEFETADTDSDENAMCYFTSGTTGYPKMCIHAHSYGIGHQTTGNYWLDLSADDLHWNISDTGWAKAAWSSYFGPWNCGATIFVHHAAGFSAKRTLELIEQFPITTMCGAPTIYRMLVLEDLKKYKFDTLRHSVGAGEPLNPEIIEIWKEATGITIRDGYGQTETVILCGSFPCIEPRFGSMGKPAPGIDLCVIDNDGNPVAANTEGDIAVKVKPERPQGLFREYKDNPEKTAETFKGDWYLTGDRAYKDEDGYFWFVSRADDVILSAGYRIGPFEVESALIEHEAVAESAVVSSPDETRGEVVKAFVILAPGFEASDELMKELQNHVKSVTAPYKYPRKLEFVDSLPKTVSGKIRRIELREQEWAR
ncbi:MAG: AMP-binding protein [Gammaproteobacteria bacterium]|jgi:acyl-coenzyme A synthetase/AMP-(fatty) acid ligase|nr:AMP-binding protein [Gammaproteobacteria bacterium]